jgi:hypothetical protein
MPQCAGAKKKKIKLGRAPLIVSAGETKNCDPSFYLNLNFQPPVREIKIFFSCISRLRKHTTNNNNNNNDEISKQYFLCVTHCPKCLSFNSSTT